jgi:hypothetical protein
VVLIASQIIRDEFLATEGGRYRSLPGSGSGLAPILLVAAEETSLGCVERLEHEYALKAELDADWAARPVALMHYNNRMALVLEYPGPIAFPARSRHWQAQHALTDVLVAR